MRDSTWCWMFAGLAALSAACGGAQRTAQEPEAAPASSAGTVMTGDWCAAEARPNWLPDLLATGVYPPLSPTPHQEPPKELGTAGLPDVDGEFVSVGLVDLELDGVGELIATWSQTFDDGPFTSVGVWRCTPDGWSALEMASAEYLEQDVLLRLGVPERVPGADAAATVHIREEWAWTGEAFGTVGLVLVEDGFVAVMSRGEVSQRVDAGPAPGSYGREPLSVSGWMPVLDGEGWYWTVVQVDYGWEIPEELWDEPTAGDDPGDWEFYQGLRVAPVLGSNHGEEPWTADEVSDAVYVVLGNGEPPVHCTSDRGCRLLSDMDREVLAPHDFTWVLGVWSSLDSALAAIDSMEREDQVLLGNDAEIWDRLEMSADGDYDDLPPVETIHPKLRTMLELSPTWR